MFFLYFQKFLKGQCKSKSTPSVRVAYQTFYVVKDKVSANNML